MEKAFILFIRVKRSYVVWKIISIALVLLSSSALSSMTATGKIARTYPTGDRINFRLKGDDYISGNQYCYFTTNKSSSEFNQTSEAWFTLLVSAAATGKPVKVSVKKCAPARHIPAASHCGNLGKSRDEVVSHEESLAQLKFKENRL